MKKNVIPPQKRAWARRSAKELKTIFDNHIAKHMAALCLPALARLDLSKQEIEAGLEATKGWITDSHYKGWTSLVKKLREAQESLGKL